MKKIPELPPPGAVIALTVSFIIAFVNLFTLLPTDEYELFCFSGAVCSFAVAVILILISRDDRYFVYRDFTKRAAYCLFAVTLLNLLCLFNESDYGPVVVFRIIQFLTLPYGIVVCIFYAVDMGKRRKHILKRIKA